MLEVQSGTADFQAILVYDVSRWGRFQDADEGTYPEHLCSRAGLRVHYCGEQFDNDGSIGSILLKNVKRVMAGEYSRELSVKVFAGQCRLIEHSEPDPNPGLERYAANARAVQQAIKNNPAERERIAKVVRELAYAEFVKYGLPIGHGAILNGWARPAVVGNCDTDYIARTLITYGGI
jgi:DNA invertase Pin-like site-specific DNA recombinase